MSQQILFFFSALGAFNGILLGFYFLFFLRPKHISSFYLGLLLLALSVRIGKSVFFYFYEEIAEIYIQFGLLACWLIGPLLFFYSRAALELLDKNTKRPIYILVGLAIIAIIVILCFPRSEYIALWVDVLIWVIYGQWFLFVLLSGYILLQHRNTIFKKMERSSFQVWISSIYFGNLMICLAFLLGNYTSYISGALSFSFVFYTLVMLLLYAKKREELLFLRFTKYKNVSLTPEEFSDIANRLKTLIVQDKIYLNPKLNVIHLAEKLSTTPPKLSQVLNEYLNTNFNDFINKYRIEEAKTRISTDDHLTLEAIGIESGFNSKSTFYTAFKKHTGTTPSKFRKGN